MCSHIRLLELSPGPWGCLFLSHLCKHPEKSPFSLVLPSPRSQLHCPSFLTWGLFSRGLRLLLGPPLGTGCPYVLPAMWGHRKFGACLRTICRHSSHCHFSSRAFHLGISSYIPQNLLCFCETPHSRGRCRAPSQIQALCASSITILSSTLPDLLI